MHSTKIAGLLLWCCATAVSAYQGNALIGVKSGYAIRRGDIDITILPFAVDDRYSDSGVINGLLLGYQRERCGWLWGIEAHVDWQSFSQLRQFSPFDLFLVHNQYQRHVVYSLSATMGYQMAPYFWPYLRMGAESSKDKLRTILSAGGVDYYLSDKKMVSRYLLGVGTEIPLFSSPLSLRLEYNYHSRGKSLGVSQPFFGAQLETQMHPRTQSILFSLVWYL